MALADLLQRADESDPAARDELFALLYGELHRLAERHLRRGGDGLTLGATTLVHEAWLSMASAGAEFPDQARFFGYASRAMRGLMIDFARRRRARKRGRDVEITLVDDAAPAPDDDASGELEALGDALDELGEVDGSLAELVDLHFFCGFSFAEIAGFRGVSERTVQRGWQKARMLLRQTMKDDAPPHF
jgi:RNA polymerase sigma factor (TIGR02999 family)